MYVAENRNMSLRVSKMRDSESLMVDYPCLRLKSKRDRGRVEIEETRSPKRIESSTLAFIAQSILRLSCYHMHSYGPRVVTLQQCSMPSSCSPANSSATLLLMATSTLSYARRRAGFGCGHLDRRPGVVTGVARVVLWQKC